MPFQFVWLTVIVYKLNVLLLFMNSTVVTPTTVVKQSSLEKITGYQMKVSNDGVKKSTKVQNLTTVVAKLQQY